MNKFSLTLAQTGPCAQNPRFAELAPEFIYLNDVILPASIDPDGAYNPRGIGLWVIGHEHGPICAVWASGPQEAMDNGVDLYGLECLRAEVQDHGDESLTALGNAGELFDLSYAWLGRVEFDPARDIKLIVSIVRASENQQDTLGG